MEELTSAFNSKLSVCSKANFSDLPLELVEKIVEETDLPSRLALRKVSKYLRSLVNKLNPMFKHVGILINSKCIKVDLEGVSIHYTNMKYDKCLVGKPGRKPKRIDGDNMDAMFNDLLTFMSPDTCLEQFGLTFTDDVSYEKFKKLRPKRMPFEITAYSFCFKANARQSIHQGIYMLDFDELKKVESDWMEIEDIFTMRHIKGWWVRLDLALWRSAFFNRITITTNMEELTSVFNSKLSVCSKANFSDLPLELVEKIVKETDLPSRLALRKVSKYLRNLVNKLNPMFKNVGILINSKCIKVDLEGVSIHYTNMKYDKCLVGKPGRKAKKVDGHNMDVMFNDLLTFMSSATCLEQFALTFTDDVSYEKFKKLRPKRVPFEITAYSLFFKSNAYQSLNRGLEMLDFGKLKKVEGDLMEEEDYFTLRHIKAWWVRTGEEFLGEESYVRLPSDFTQNQKERKIKDKETGKRANYFKFK